MEDLTVKASGYDFGAAHAALRRYVDGNILAGVSLAVLVGRDLVEYSREAVQIFHRDAVASGFSIRSAKNAA